MKASLPPDEAQRLAVLRQCRVLDSPPEEQYDDIARLAAHICGVPIAAVSLIDTDRQYFKSIVGLDVRETPREAAFCAHTVLQSDVLVIPDAFADPRFADNPLVVGDPDIRFYAGAPLVTSDGYALGSLCVIDRVPRTLTADQEAALRVLARQVTGQLESARRQAEREAGEAERRRLAAIVASATDAIWSADLDSRLTSWNAGAERLYGYGASDVLGRHQSLLLLPEEREFLPEIIAALGRGETRENLQVRRRRKDGEWRDVSLTFSPIHGEDGSLAGVSAYARDITAQKRVEAALQTEQEFVRALLESLQEGIVACDAGGTLTLFNRATREFHGLPEQPLPPEQWAEHFDLFLADGKTPMPTADIPLFRAFSGEVVRDAEMVIKPKNGPPRTLLAGGQAIRGRNGEKLGAVAAMHDITERRRAEAALAESETRLRRLSNAAFEGIAVSQNGRLVDANDAFAAMFGYESAAALAGVGAECLAAPESRALVARKVAECDEAPYEATLQRQDSTTFPAEVRGRRIDFGGRPARVTAVRDVTRQKALEAELRAREESLRAVLESAPVILFTADAAGTITLSEGTGLIALGLTPGEAVGRSVFEFCDGPEAEAATRRALAGESVSYDVRVGGLTLHTEVQPLRAADGLPAGLIGVSFDVTERVSSEERFRVLFEQSSDPHMLCDAGGGIIECNDATLKLLRCRDKSLLRSLHPASLSPEFQPDGSCSVDKAIELLLASQGQKLHRFEWTHRNLEGEDFPVEVTCTPLTINSGPALLVVWHDLTERKRAEQQIKDYSVVLEHQKQALEEANAELERLATTDGLTGLKNHRAFRDHLSGEISRARRFGAPLALVLLDVDHFKQYNDTFGHPAGDDVLRRVAHLLQAHVRETDIVARYGGEEFVLLLPQTDRAGALALTERIRRAIEGGPWPQRPVTASFGVALLGLGSEAVLVAEADAALYRSKNGGRNRVTCAPEIGPADIGGIPALEDLILSQ